MLFYSNQKKKDTTHGCPGTLDQIGLVAHVDVFLNNLLPLTDAGAANSCLHNCGKDQGVGGIVPCVCQLFNTLIPWRDDPALPVNCTLGSLNCQKVDLCCPFVKIGVGLNVLIKFINRAIASLWQSWDGGLPEFFVHFIFCDEEAGALPCGGVNNNCAYTGLMPEAPICACGTFTCGQLIPVIQSIADPAQGLISQCLCELVNLLDELLVLVFDAIGSSWPGCFCSQITGTLRSGPYVAREILLAIVGFLRKFPLPCYWNPAGHTETQIGGIFTTCTPQVTPGCECVFVKGPVNDIESSWIFSFAGPVANALCVSVGNLMCFVNSIFFIPVGCLGLGEKFLGSTARWGTDLAFRIVAFIEGFVRQFTDPVPACVGVQPMCAAPTAGSGSFSGVSPAPLANLLTSLLSWPVDMFIGDGPVSCSYICPKNTRFQTNVTLRCQCYQLSPNTNALNSNHQSVWSVYISSFDGFGNPIYGCNITSNPVFGPVEPISRLRGTNGISGVGATFPDCSNFLDYTAGQAGYPGSCANYSLCRPDTLPSCGVPVGWPDDLIANNYMGPIDGQIQGFIRYIACAIGPSGFEIAKPLLYMNSIIWQLYGAIVRFLVSCIIFLLGFFSLSGGCGCWDQVDPKQDSAIVRHVQGHGFIAGFCYTCPDAHGPCGGQAGQPTLCEPHCPFNQNTTDVALAQQRCETMLTGYSNSANWPGSATATTICDGSFQTSFINQICLGASPDCRNFYNTEFGFKPPFPVSCAQPFCQVNGTGSVPLHPSYINAENRGSEEPANPLVLCSFLTLIQKFLDVVNAFAALFSTPLILPDHKRDGHFAPFVGPVSRKNMSQFYDTVSGDNRKVKLGDIAASYLMNAKKKKRNENGNGTVDYYQPPASDQMVHPEPATHGGYDQTIPSTPELILMALYDYDTSDCFTDPVACYCRNFYVPSHCKWTSETGTIPTIGRNRKYMPAHLRDRRDADQTMTVEEVFGMATEKFNDTTVCDQAVQLRATMMHETMPQTYMERWVGCIDKRIQGERVAVSTGYVATPDLLYSTQAPLKIYTNIINTWKVKNAEKRRKYEEDGARKRSEIDTAYPNLQKLLIERAEKGRRYLQQVKQISPYAPMFEAIVQADEIWYKYSIGYYGYMITRALKHYEKGDWHWPNQEDSATELRFAVQNLKYTIMNQPYMEVITGLHSNTVRAFNFARDVVSNVGVVNYVRQTRRAYGDYVDGIRKSNEPRKRSIIEKFKRMPIYNWWSMPSNSQEKGIITPFLQHLSNVIAYRRYNWKRGEPSVKEKFIERWTNPVWTPDIVDNWRRVGRVFYSIYNVLFPGALSLEEKQRFLFDGNCKILTRSVDVIVKVADYCANIYVYNNNFTRRTRLADYLIDTSPHRSDTFFASDNFARYNYTNPSDPHAYARPELQERYIGPGSSHPSLFVGRQVYKRASHAGPAGFNFLNWIVDVISDILHSWFNFNSSSWIADARAWLQNPNTQESDYPNVGLRYWILFMVRCEFQDNLNCSKGVGLTPALLWVSVGVLGALIVGYYILSPVSFIIQIITVPILWAVLVGTIGLHYSPRLVFFSFCFIKKN